MIDGLAEPAGNEHALRMGHALALNALVLISAFRFVRIVADAGQRVVDTLLLWIGVQYATVMICGLAGVLNAWAMTAAAVLAGGALCVAAMRRRVPDATMLGSIDPAPAGKITILTYASPHTPRPQLAWERYLFWAGAAFLLGYGGAVLWNQYFITVMSDDALTYHVPAAIRWLQSGRIGLHETWFFNPANTWSPLAGSSFIAWWFAPLGNDWLARFVQAPALALIFVTMVRLGRLLGAPLSVAVIVALAAALSRPFMRQIIVTKDDLYLAGFFLAAVLALSRENLTDRLGPWRVGMAVGLFLATKYTALLALPVLLLMIDAPVRAKWRVKEWGMAIGVAAIIVGPWFVRNWWLTGNPLFPIDVNVLGVRVFDGMFTTRRSEELRTLSGVWRILTDTHFSMLPLLFVTLVAACVGAATGAGRKILTDPLTRACVAGPVLGIAVFALVSPYAEVRFVDPAFLMMFACAALAHSALPIVAGLPLALVLFGVSVYTGFYVNRWTFIGGGVVLAIIVAAAALIQERLLRLGWRGGAIVAAAAALALAAYLYVHQDTDVRNYRQLTETVWLDQYGAIADGWAFVRAKVPPDAVLAYTNTQFAYPLMGFEAHRRLVYAPTRPGVTRLHTLPRLEAVAPGEQLVAEVARVTVAEPDRETWMENLRRAGAEYLFVAKTGVVKDPPELAFARAEPGRFEMLFENSDVVVYRIR